MEKYTTEPGNAHLNSDMETIRDYSIIQLTSEHCFVILMLLYFKFTVISCLIDYEDMKPVVPTHVVLFQ